MTAEVWRDWKEDFIGTFYANNQQEKDKTGQNGTLVVGRVEEEKFITKIINDLSD
jgi:hypothetical protein